MHRLLPSIVFASGFAALNCSQAASAAPDSGAHTYSPSVLSPSPNNPTAADKAALQRVMEQCHLHTGALYFIQYDIPHEPVIKMSRALGDTDAQFDCAMKALPADFNYRFGVEVEAPEQAETPALDKQARAEAEAALNKAISDLSAAQNRVQQPAHNPPPRPVPGNYFPPAFLTPTISCNFGPRGRPMAVVTDIENRWYSAQLAAAREPSLYLASLHRPAGSGETVRFTWLRSFDPAIVVRVDGIGTSAPRLIAKQLSGAGGYAPGSITRHIDRPLTTAEQKTLELALSETKIMTLPPKDCGIGLDGAEWLIEGIDSGGYHLVQRWSPQSGAVRDVGLALLNLTGWDEADLLSCSNYHYRPADFLLSYSTRFVALGENGRLAAALPFPVLSCPRPHRVRALARTGSVAAIAAFRGSSFARTRRTATFW